MSPLLSTLIFLVLGFSFGRAWEVRRAAEIDRWCVVFLKMLRGGESLGHGSVRLGWGVPRAALRQLKRGGFLVSELRFESYPHASSGEEVRVIFYRLTREGQILADAYLMIDREKKAGSQGPYR